MKKIIFWFIFLVGIGGPVAGLFGQWHWLPDLASHFLPQETLLLILTTFLLLILKDYRKFIVSLLILIVCVGSIMPYCGIFRLKPEVSESLTIISSNVNTANRDYGRVIELVRKMDPDIVFFEEINREWDHQLRTHLADRYRLIQSVPREDNFGVALFSKIDLKDLNVRYVGPAEVPSYQAVIPLKNSEIVLWATHPVPPARNSYWHMRNRQLSDLRDLIAKDTRPTIVVGDLNATPWCWWFRYFKAGRLRDSAIGFGIQNSWPTMWPWFMRIPIDHVLVSKELKIVDRKILEDVGSDHYPVMVRVGV